MELNMWFPPDSFPRIVVNKQLSNRPFEGPLEIWRPFGKLTAKGKHRLLFGTEICTLQLAVVALVSVLLSWLVLCKQLGEEIMFVMRWLWKLKCNVRAQGIIICEGIIHVEEHLWAPRVWLLSWCLRSWQMRGCGRKLCACARGSAARGGLSACLLSLAPLVSLYFLFCGVSLPFCLSEHKHSGLGELYLALEAQSNDEFHWKFYIMTKFIHQHVLFPKWRDL